MKKRILSLALASAMAVGTVGGAFAETETVEVKSGPQYIVGDEAGNFNPNSDITRQEMAVMIGKAIEEKGSNPDFKDADKIASWAAEFVAGLQDAEIVEGDDAGNFNPLNKISRAELATMVVRSYEKVTGEKLSEGDESFDDVPESAWYASAVKKAAAAGLVKGDGSGSFNPDGNATRAESVVMVNRVLGLEVEEGAATDLPTDLKDMSEWPSWAKDAILLASSEYSYSVDESGNIVLEASVSSVSVSTDEDVATVSAVVKNAAEGQKATVEIFANGDTEADAVVSEEVEIVDGAVSTEIAGLPAGDHVARVTVGESSKDADFSIVITDLAVQSVSAINANEIKITFNKEVDKSSAEDASNYDISVDGSAISATGTIKSKRLDDKKSVILYDQTGTTTLNAMLVDGSSYKVDVKDVLDTDFDKVVEYEGTYKVFEDKTAPKLVSAVKQSNDTVKITFDEPVNDDMVVKVDGTTLNATNTVSVSTEAGEYYVVTSALTGDLVTDGDHSLQIYNATDVAGNVAGLIQTTLTITPDTVAPSVESITAKDADTFKVKFSETITGLSDANFEVKKGTYTFPDSRIGNYRLDSDDSTDTTYLVDVTAIDADNPLYGTDESSAELTVTVEGYKDNASLVGADYTGTVTLNKDETAPAIKSEKLNTTSGSQYLEITFDETLASADNTKINVTKDGVIMTVVGAAVSGADSDVLKIDMGATNVTEGTYVVTLSKGAVKDTSNNENAATSTTIVKDAASTPLTIVADSAPVGTIAALEAGIATGDTNVITINYNEKMTDSAINLANYKLDGLALPAGTTAGFSSAAKTQVEITLPEETVVVEGSAKLLDISKDVKSDAGKTVMNADKSAISVIVNGFEDNVKPLLESGKFVVTNDTQTTTNRVLLKFNENMMNPFSSTSGNIDDFKVTVGGTKVSVSQIYDETAGDKEVVLVLASNVNISQGLKVEVLEAGSATNAAINVTDVNGNKLTENTVIDITEKSLDTAFDTTAPTFATATMASDNANNTLAKVGDTVTLTIVSSEDISAPTVTIDGNTATIDNNSDADAKTWNATYTLQAGDTEGALAFTLDAVDLAGNSATQVTAVTGGSAVTFDETAPTLVGVTGTAGEATDNKWATGETLIFTFSEELSAASKTAVLAAINTQTDAGVKGTGGFAIGAASGTNGAAAWTVVSGKSVLTISPITGPVEVAIATAITTADDNIDFATTDVQDLAGNDAASAIEAGVAAAVTSNND